MCRRGERSGEVADVLHLPATRIPSSNRSGCSPHSTKALLPPPHCYLISALHGTGSGSLCIRLASALLQKQRLQACRAKLRSTHPLPNISRATNSSLHLRFYPCAAAAVSIPVPHFTVSARCAHPCCTHACMQATGTPFSLLYHMPYLQIRLVLWPVSFQRHSLSWRGQQWGL